MAPNLETEIKLAIADLHGLLAKLRGLAARQLSRVHERNTLFDTPSHYFRRHHAFLRIRTESPVPRVTQNGMKGSTAGRLGLLTYKGPVAGHRQIHPKYKILEEIEYHLPNADRFARLLVRLGFKPSFRYEKIRIRYRLPRLRELHLDLDQTPIGTFLELEGPQQQIDFAARALGFRATDYIAVSYMDLFGRWARHQRPKPSDMLFARKNLPYPSLFA